VCCNKSQQCGFVRVNEASKPEWTKIVNQLHIDNSEKGRDVEIVQDILPK
jgi:hypothetical protein